MYNLRNPRQRARYLRATTRRRDSNFRAAERIIRLVFAKERKAMILALPRVGKVDKGEWARAFRRVWILAGGDAWRYNEETWGGAQRQVLSKPHKDISPLLLYSLRYQFKAAPTAWLVHVADYIDTKGGDNITEITATTQDKVKNAIFAGVEREEGIPQIADRVAGVYDGFEGYRATTIARSEVVDASNQASLAQAREAGSTLDLMWVATNDDRTREEHAEMDGVTVAYDQEFDCADGTTMPGEAVNCRCTIGYAVPEVEPTPVEEPTAEGGIPTFENNADATQYVRDNLGVGAQFQGVPDMEVTNNLVEGMVRLSNDEVMKAEGIAPSILSDIEKSNTVLFTVRGDETMVYVNTEMNYQEFLQAYKTGAGVVSEGKTPGLVSFYADSAKESMMQNLEHEYAHLIQNKWESEGNFIINDVFTNKVQYELGNNLSVYSAYSEREAFAESYTAWRHGITEGIPEDVLNFFKRVF